MRTRKLRRLLEELRLELAETSSDNPELQESLQAVADQVDRSLSELDSTESGDLDHESLWQRIGEARDAFEATHPKLTAMLSNILNALSENRI